MVHSCLYRGYVRHQRPSPAHRFQYSTSWAYLDLTEVADVLNASWCLSDVRFAPACFRRADHFGDSTLSMIDSVYDLVKQQTGLVLSGPVRVLTQLRHFGFYFSPINVFYCFNEQDSLVALVAEVSNTPWNERHCYVLWEGNRLSNSASRYSHPKTFHVSPFMGMDSQYEWRIRPPEDQLHLSLGCLRGGERIFHASLHLNREELTDGQIVRSMLRRPIAAAHIIGAIYYQAFRLWMKKCQFYTHPRNLRASSSKNASQVALQPAEKALADRGL